MEKTTQRGALCSVVITKYHSGDQIKKTETSRACSTYGRQDRCLQGSSEGDHLIDPGVYGRIIVKRIFETWDGGMDLICLAQDRGRWRALVNAAMNVLVP